MKSALLILLCVLGAGYFILFYEISKVSAEGGNGQLSKSMRLDSPIENYPCDDKDIIIEIDEIPLKLPRHKTDILFNNGTKLDGLSEVPFMCDIKIFKNAVRIRRPHFFIFSKSGTSSLVHALKSDYIFIEGNFTLVEKYTINNSEVYAWNYSLTTDVAIQRKASSCPEVEKVRIYDVCTTFFSHPSGLGFAYSLARTNRSIEDYVKILEETHEVLEAIFVTENPDQAE